MRDMLARLRGELFTAWCRLFRKNIRIGPGLRIYKRFSIRGSGTVGIGKNCLVDGIIGDRRQYCCIDTGNADSRVRIGDNARLFAVKMWVKFSVVIGSDVLIEECGIIDTDFHSIDRLRTSPPPLEHFEKCRIIIGDRVCIGARSVMTKGVSIGDDAVISPGSIITRSIPARFFACGNPAKISGPIDGPPPYQEKIEGAP